MDDQYFRTLLPGVNPVESVRVIGYTPRPRIGRPEEPTATTTPTATAVAPWVDLYPTYETAAYSVDRRHVGLMEVTAGWRMSDVLNEDLRVLLSRVAVLPHAGGLPGRAQEISLPRDDVYIVHLGGPRGDRELYRTTIQTPLGMRLGPYLVRGFHHTLPGAASMVVWPRERVMVPLTDAWIEYPMRQRRVPVRVPAIAVNRLLVDWVTVAPYDTFEAPR